MPGEELLAKVRERYPRTVRLVLSGQANKDCIMDSVGPIHQFLQKPCDPEVLTSAIQRTTELGDLFDDESLRELVCGLESLPSLPSHQHELISMLQMPEVSGKLVGGAIKHDVAMTAKLLQLVNSSFFGLGKCVVDIYEGIGYLGADIIRALVASNGAFSAFESEQTTSLEAFWHHSALTGLLAGRIVEMEIGTDRLLQGEAVQAGMLHDVGQLALAARLPGEFRSTRDGFAAVSTYQRARIGCDHDRVGAYLMGLWGLSDRIVEAIAYHHHPRECAFSGWSPLTAVHAANALINEQLGMNDSELDSAYLASVGCGRRIDHWRREAEQVVSRGCEPSALVT